MKRVLGHLAPLLILILLLTGCSKAAGGSYKLEYITADGLRYTPSALGLSMRLELKEDGTGTATLSGSQVEITWTDDGGTLTAEGPRGSLEFTKDGSSLVLHDDGMLLFLTPEEEEED